MEVQERPKLYYRTELTEQQKLQVSKLAKRKRALIVSKTGTGKTLVCLTSFISLYNRNHVDNLLVLTPRNAYQYKVWDSECRKHTTIRAIDLEELHNLCGRDTKRVLAKIAQYKVVYTKHSIVSKYADYISWLRQLTRFVVVYDEIHAIRNPKTSLHRLTRFAIQNSYVLWGATATPLSKNMTDAYNIINFIRPWFLGTYEAFKRDYCKVQEQVIGRFSNGKLKKVENIIGILNKTAFEMKLESLVIKGSAAVPIEFHYHPYQLSQKESLTYKRLAKGIFAKKFQDVDADSWFKSVMSDSDEESYSIGKVDRHSSRFLYLQFAADGIVQPDGKIEYREMSSKIATLLLVLNPISQKRESAIIYFDYYASLDAVEGVLKKVYPRYKILRSTGETPLESGAVTAQSVKVNPVFILITKSGSASSSFGFINHAIPFHIPTTPETFIQFVGRITRQDSLFKGDIHAHILISDNVDKYKLCVVSSKAEQMESMTDEETNIPMEFRNEIESEKDLKALKKYLLWNTI